MVTATEWLKSERKVVLEENAQADFDGFIPETVDKLHGQSNIVTGR